MRFKKKLRYLAGVIIMAAETLTLVGCVDTGSGTQRAQKALEEKYHENFEILSLKNGGLFQDYYTVMAYSEEYPLLPFQASINTKTDAVSDSYVTRRVGAKISEKVLENISTLSCDYYVFTEARYGETLLSDPDISIEEYLAAEPTEDFSIHICMNPEQTDSENVLSALTHTFDETAGINGSVLLYLTDEEGLAEIREYVESHDITYGEFDEMTEDSWIGTLEVSNSSFVLTETKWKEMAGDRL